MARIEVATATDEEAAACLALLAEPAAQPAELLAARLDGELVGAAAIVWQMVGTPPGFPLALHVTPAARRRGVGRRLVGAATALATGETDGLWSYDSIGDAGPPAAFLQACGFTVGQRELHFRMEASFHSHIAAILERLRRHNRISPALSAIALADAPLESVARLVSFELDAAPGRLLHELRSDAPSRRDAIDLERSVVVMDGEQVAGALLYRWHGGHPVIEANVVGKAWRNSAVGVLQLELATRRGVEGGATGFEFHCDENVRDSVNLAKRSGGRLTGSKVRYYHALTSDR